jgi:uncharacterized membrane protein
MSGSLFRIELYPQEGYMPRYLVSVVAAGFVLAFQWLPAHAGIIVCNDTGLQVSVAIGWNSGKAWDSRGWYNIKPRDCALPLSGELTNRYVYYYAKAGNLKWQGGNDGAWFCADPRRKFHYSYEVDPPCDGYVFRRVDAGVSQQATIKLTESTTDPKTAAINCRSKIAEGRDEFVRCWTRQVATEKQRIILNCVEETDTAASLAICATKNHISGDAARIADCSLRYSEHKQTVSFARCIGGGRIGEKEARLVDCAIENRGNYSAVGLCAAGTNLTADERRLYDCIADNYNDYRAAGLCVAGKGLSDDQRRVANCVMHNRGSYVQMGVCAAGGNLTAEQQVFVQCAASTGGQPYAFAGCVGTQLTLNELDKCISHGIGGSGCFGSNNTAVKFVQNAWKDVTKGPGPSNDLLGRDGIVRRTLRGTERDLRQGPGPGHDVVGRDGFVRRNAPPPIEVGRVGGHRVCIPWC